MTRPYTAVHEWADQYAYLWPAVALTHAGIICLTPRLYAREGGPACSVNAYFSPANVLLPGVLHCYFQIGEQVSGFFCPATGMREMAAVLPLV